MEYADVEAVRVLHRQGSGWTRSLDALWDRYRIPLAITECHLGCSVDEQQRWLAGAWSAAVAAREAGVPVEAVTVWALLGSHDWNSLLTRDDGHYEAGVFDLSHGGPPRPTALASAIRRLARDGVMPGAQLGPGWWEADARFEYPPCHPDDEGPRLFIPQGEAAPHLVSSPE
jgi:dTDP-4-dehydrorhamnose reductase